MAQRVRKAVFPVAGLGTRFLPATKSMPKELLPVVDKPVIHYAVDEDSAHARSTADAPEIDGMVFIDDAQHLEPGTFAEVEITESSEYDLFARLL